jgi:hypothetical protein
LNDEPVNHKDIYIRYELLREMREFFYTYMLL